MREFNELKAAEMAKLAKEYETRLEAKNELILAEQDRKVNEASEQRRRDELRESQQMQ